MSTTQLVLGEAERPNRVVELTEGSPVGRLSQRLDAPFTVAQLTDDGLRRLAVTYQRDLEDIAAGDLPASRRRQIEVYLADVEHEVEGRAALAAFWNAVEGGARFPSDYWQPWDGRGPRTPIEGARPSYRLAQRLDFESFKRFGRSALAWGST